MNQLSVKIAVRMRISFIRNRFLKLRISLAETNNSIFSQQLIFRFFLKTGLLIALSFLPFSRICFARIPSSPDSLKFENAFQSYLRIRSISGDEYAAGRYLKDLGDSFGLVSECLNCTDTSINIALSLYPLSTKKPNLILLSHLDVVGASDSVEWRFHPFAGTRTDSDFVGRGALDAKGLTFMQLGGLIKFKESVQDQELPFNVTILAVCGEETGGFRGARALVDHYMDKLQPWAVYGEGGSGIKGIIPSYPEIPVFGIAVAEKVNLWLRLDLKFSSFGHGAAPPNSYVNKDMMKALHKLGQVEGRIEFHTTTKRMFRELGKMEGGLTGWVIRHIHWKIFRPVVRKVMEREPVFSAMLQNTAVLTNMFNPPGPPNQISTRATAFLDCRLLPETKIKKFIREIKYGLIEPRFKVSILNQCPEAEESNPDLFEYQCFARAIQETFPGAKTAPILFPASSDNNYFRQFRIPTYGITPVLMSRTDVESIHGTNERIKFTDFWRGVEVFRKFLFLASKLPPKIYFTPISNR
jgi:carboxypeptidase PM20D1